MPSSKCCNCVPKEKKAGHVELSSMVMNLSVRRKAGHVELSSMVMNLSVRRSFDMVTSGLLEWVVV